MRKSIIEGVALVEGGARKERLEFPGGAFQGQPPPDPPQALLLGEECRQRSWLEAVGRSGQSWYRVGLWPSWGLTARHRTQCDQ